VKRGLKQFLKRHLWFLVAFHRLLLRPKSYLHRTGWVASLRRGYPCRRDGSEVPWMNYAVIRLLEERLTDQLELFEFGSGYSTIFYGRRVRSVHSVEHDRRWFEHLASRLPDNATVAFRDLDTDGAYCRAIAEPGLSFDVIVVDGRDRVNCARQATRHLSEGGVVILDDSSRERYRDAFEHLRQEGFRALSLEGISPTSEDPVVTTIFYRDGNCLGL
jgi:hypothetical protein